MLSNRYYYNFLVEAAGVEPASHYLSNCFYCDQLAADTGLILNDRDAGKVIDYTN